MALSPSGFQIEDNQQSINQQSMDQGLGTPESPVGAKVAGANQDQAKMVGTPAQQQGAQQVQPKPAETLESRKRYQQATPSQNMQATADAARQKAEDLKALGPTRTKVQAYIEAQMAGMAGQTGAQLQLQDDLSFGITEGKEIDGTMMTTAELEAAGKTALENYIKAVNDGKTTTELEPLLQEVAKYTGITDMDTFLEDNTVSLGAQAGALIADEVTMGNLVGEGPNQLGEDEFSAMAVALGISEEELAGMTLAELENKIDAVEAEEFSQVANIEAQLADPNLPPALREQLQGQLNEMSAAGLVGLESDVGALEQMVLQGETIEFMGKEISVEKLLSDNELSSIVAKALEDDDYLAKLQGHDSYAGLASWITTNRDALTDLVGELEKTEVQFTATQANYKDYKTNQWGSETESLMKDLFGDAYDDLFPESMTSSEFAALDAKLRSQYPIFGLLMDNKDLRNSEDIADLKQLYDLDIDDATAGIQKFTDSEMLEILKLKDTFTGDDLYKSLFPDAFDADGNFILPTDKDTLDVLKEDFKVFDSISPEILSTATQWIKDGTMSWEDLQDFSKLSSAQQTAVNTHYGNLTAAQSAWETAMLGSGPERLTYMLQQLGLEGVDAADLNYAISSKGMDRDGDGKISAEERAAADMILRIFDSNKDGKISGSEITNLQSAKVAKELGLDGSNNLSTIVDNPGKGGNWNGIDLGVDKYANETAKQNEYYEVGKPLEAAYVKAEDNLNKLMTSNKHWGPFLQNMMDGDRFSTERFNEIKNIMFKEFDWNSVNEKASNAHRDLIAAKKAYEANPNKETKGKYIKLREVWDGYERVRKDTFNKMSKKLKLSPAPSYSNFKNLTFNHFAEMSRNFQAYDNSWSSLQGHLNDKQYAEYSSANKDEGYRYL